MFLHIGGDTLVRSKDLIAIINVEDSPVPCEVVNPIRIAPEENFKSVIYTIKKVYLSPISSLTLKKRISYLNKLG